MAEMSNLLGKHKMCKFCTWVAQSVNHLILDFRAGHDLTAREFKPHVGLCADSSEPGACFGFCVSLSLCSLPTRILSLSLSKINKHWEIGRAHV